MSRSPSTSPTIDIDSPVFAMRFANLLRATRLEHGTSFRALVKASGQRWTKDQLRQIEDGLLTLDESMVESVSLAYGADLASILPSRLAVEVAADGVISAGGVKAVFVPRNETSLLTAYLRLIRTMRRQRKSPMIALRRDDIDVLAAHLELPGETVVDRLTALMGATLHQRTAIASMFAMGAVVIGLAGATVAGAPDRSQTIVSGKDPNPVAAVEVVQGADRTATTLAVGDAVAGDVSAGGATAASTAAQSPDSTVTTAAGAPTTSAAPASPSTAAAGTPAAPGAQPATVAVAPPAVPSPGAVTPTTANAADPPLVPDGPLPSANPVIIVATDDPPAPPSTDAGSAEPPTVPTQPSPEPTPTESTVVDVGPPPVPTPSG